MTTMTSNIRIIEQPIRDCGKRKEYAVYATGGTEGSENGVLARFNRLNPPIPYQVNVHRGPRIVDAHKILGRRPMEEWWYGSSKETEQKKAGDAWALETFGMTMTKRLSTGECAGCADGEAALSVLAQKVKFDPQIVYWFREMTRADIQEINRVAAPYNRLQEHMVRYAETHQVGELVGAQSSLWQMAYAIPPAKRQTYIPFIVRIVALMGLREDAKSMQRIFSQEK